MRNCALRQCVLVGALAVVLLAAFRVLLSGQSVDPFRLQGTVLESGTDRPLAGVRVSSTSPEFSQSVTTDSEGRFTIDAVPAGWYRVVPSHAEYIFSLPDRLRRPREPGVQVHVTAGSNTQNVHLRMVRAGTISGSVQPLAGSIDAYVYVLIPNYDEHGERGLNVVPGVSYSPPPAAASSRVRINDRGEYRFYNLPPGDYFVMVSGGAGQMTYYPGTANEGQALAVTVRAGEEVRLPALTMQQRKMTPIRFRFSESDLAQFDSEKVIFMDFHVDKYHVGKMMANSPQLRTLYDRTQFVMNAPAYASADVLVGLSSANTVLYGRSTISVEDSEIVPEIVLKRGVRMTTNVLFENAEGQRTTTPALTGTEPPPHCRFYSERSIVTSPSSCTGEFSPGLYRVEFNVLPVNFYIASARVGDKDVLADGIQLEADTALDVVVGTSGSIVRGIVKDPKGGSLSDAVVALVPDAPLRKAFPLYRSAISDVNGHFELRGIAPGAYHLFAWPEIEGNAYKNSEFMEEFKGRGLPIEIKKGDELSVDVDSF